MARDFSPVFSGADEKTRDYAVVWAAAPEGLAVVGLGRVERAVVGLDRADRVVVGLVRVGKAEGWDVQEDEGCMNCRYRRAASIGNGKFDRT